MRRSQASRIVAAILALIVGSISAAAAAPIVDAAARGDSKEVRKLLRAGTDVNKSQGDGMTPLHWAAELGDADLAGILMYAGANKEAGTRIGSYTPLHLASRNGHAGVIEALLAAKANPEAVSSNSGVMPLHLAAASDNPDAVRLLLDGGADVNAVEASWGQTPLIFAAAANRVENMRLLLEAGADPSRRARAVDVVEREKADKAADKRIVEILESFKARSNGGSQWLPQPNEVQGAIEFSRAIQRNWPNVPDPACDEAKKPEVEGLEEDLSAAGSGCSQVVEKTPDGQPVYTQAEAEEDAEPKPPTYGQLVGSWGGLTPLLHAVRQGHRDAALLLLEAGADINQPSAGDGTTPLLMAAVNGQFDLLPALLERGADPNLTSDAGTSPLFAVIERQWAPWAHYAHPVEYQRQQATHLETMSALLEAGADPNVRLHKHLWYAEYTTSVYLPAGLHYNGATPFWRAAQALDVDAMRILRKYGADPEIATRKVPKRKRQMRDPMPEEEVEEEVDYSGLPPVELGGPYIFPIHAAAGAGYGQYFMAHAHRHVPDNWLRAVRYLVEECGADVNARDANGYTPLHHAASRGDNELIGYLLAKGADVTLVSREGQSTADMANGPTQRVAPFPETIDLLVSLGSVNNDKCVSC
jgi:ankyrin repeat protein